MKLATAFVVALAACTLNLETALQAQTGLATLNGQITDPHGRVVPSTAIEAINIDTGVVYPAKSNGVGLYSISSLPPGRYRVHVKRDGFKEVNLTGLDLHTQDVLQQNFALEVGSTSESVSVEAGATNDSPAVSMTVGREFIENMPLNGRSLQDLIQLAPGTVSASSTQPGYYSINGQRTDSNYFTVDGVSANLGGYENSSSPNVGSGLSGSAPSQTVLGTTQSLASIDSLQEFTIQTSGYTAEFGRNPGGQVQLTTRSGTNDIHGSLFDYLRNTAFDANSYQNDYYGYPQTAEHQNDFGGTIGGPLSVPKMYSGRDKTFYFFSYEGLRLLLPAFEREYVPTEAFRTWASPNLQPFLNASPLPNPNSPGNQDGCTITDSATGQPTACDSLFTYGYSYPNNLDNISVRLDQNLGKKFHAFVRYADTPSTTVTGAESATASEINAHTWTAGLTVNISHNVLDEIRFNYSHDGEDGLTVLKPLGGAVPWTRSLLIPALYDTPFTYANPDIEVRGTGLYSQSYVGGSYTVQHQYQVVNGLTWARGKHSVKVGGDWRRLTPLATEAPYDSYMAIDNLSDIQNGNATELVVSREAPGKPVVDNLSLYAQDHWKINSRLSLDYGLRWEFNPPPGPSNGFYPVTLTSSDLTTAQLAPLGTQPYKTNYHSFAPRLGFAWNALPFQRHPMTLRGGFGIFFDTGQTTVLSAYFGSFPFFVSGATQANVPLPLSSAELTPPSLQASLTPPYPYLNGISASNLTLPYTEQWNLSVDEILGRGDTLTLSYVGNSGRKLLFSQEYYNGVPQNPNFAGGLVFTDNASQSGYNSFQVQDTGKITNDLNLVTSFSWSHALDNASNDFSGFAPLWGNSDNDVRRVLNLALNYERRMTPGGDWLRVITRGWLLANRFSTQSGYPTDVIQTTLFLPQGQYAAYAPDLVPNVPIYLHGRAADVNGEPVPGDWRLNPDAFAAVPTDANTGNPIRQGTLGRNYVRNPPFWTLNSALQRSFPIHESLRLNFRAEAFNIFNHPSLSGPDTGLSDSTFGELFGITTIGSGNQLYAMGAARSLQLSLKLEF